MVQGYRRYDQGCPRRSHCEILDGGFTHCFQKKTQKTSKHDLYLAAKRMKELTKELN
ncbi:type II toxin-antitoxin system RelE/ParE family toxin [Pseudomonas syringae]|uniref:type II toxin-antitoxin system RelE/ParE family toxin n=1 Tax=Pseudomonas syringae TaxID=317 RepID=UPI003F88DAB6